ncbi:MAG: serine/threonine protein phosphatase [Pseudomonas sp.]|uniref:PP2C family protein-serine/threonine phosphatase n=1 Tax=Pseudomonas sp. TaxID=306 RepID=UPI00261B5F95|nr:protein phosphatase 2C domain-containing protein [Pseudomonas sp.]MDB6050864.1 serine/threonine protein phosphatase [Pseudomonas sp.]
MNTSIPLSPSRPYRMTIGTAFGITDIGTVRRSNEDNFLIDEKLDLAIVADGMGGHAAGEVASAGALNAVQQFLRRARAHGVPYVAADHSATIDPDATRSADHDQDATVSDLGIMAVSLMFDAVEFANQTLYAQNLAHDRAEGGMGTTLTGFCRPFADGELIFFHVGDSRLYCLRDRALMQLTRDQTLYQQALDAGIRDNLPPRNMLLQALGPTPDVLPEIRTFKLQPNDLLMLCSDGLHGAVSHAEIQQILATTCEVTLEQDCARLVTLSKKYGGRDNITVLLMLCHSDPG